MATDFVSATDLLFKKTKPEELAKEIGCAVTSIAQARVTEDRPGHRSPPPGWEAAVARLARQKAAQLQKLAEKLGGTK